MAILTLKTLVVETGLEFVDTLNDTSPHPPQTDDTWEHEGINRVFLANGAWKEIVVVGVGGGVSSYDDLTEKPDLSNFITEHPKEPLTHISNMVSGHISRSTGTWALLARTQFTPDVSYQEANALYAITSNASGQNSTAIIEVFFRVNDISTADSDGNPRTPSANGAEVRIISMTGAALSDDSFKVFDSGPGTDIELWVRKDSNWFALEMRAISVTISSNMSIQYYPDGKWHDDGLCMSGDGGTYVGGVGGGGMNQANRWECLYNITDSANYTNNLATAATATGYTWVVNEPAANQSIVNHRDFTSNGLTYRDLPVATEAFVTNKQYITADAIPNWLPDSNPGYTTEATPAWVPATDPQYLSGSVVSTSSGNGGTSNNNAGNWAHIATATFPGGLDYQDAVITYQVRAVTESSADNTFSSSTALISVSLGTTILSNIVKSPNYGEISVITMEGPDFESDSFRLIDTGGGQDIELWVRKITSNNDSAGLPTLVIELSELQVRKSEGVVLDYVNNLENYWHSQVYYTILGDGSWYAEPIGFPAAMTDVSLNVDSTDNGYITSHQSLSDYVTTTALTAADYVTATTLTAADYVLLLHYQMRGT